MLGAILHYFSLGEIFLEMSYIAWVTNTWLVNDLKHVQYFASNIITSRLSYIDQLLKVSVMNNETHPSRHTTPFQRLRRTDVL